MREGDLKYVWRQDGDELEDYLFDLDWDPSERTNLIVTMGDRADALKRKLADWERQMKANI